MARIIIIGEGPTEQSFCNDVLKKHFSPKDIYIDNPVIKKSNGGIVSWQALKFQIEKHLKQEQNVFVTTLIDYYGMHQHHKYPNWQTTSTWPDKEKRIEEIEKGMLEDLDENFRSRFIPYIQLHEFECILFSDIEVIKTSFEKNEFLDYDYLLETIDGHENPEMINDGPETAPSKRLYRIIDGYDKITHGSLLAEDIGLVKIREKCSRFDKWIRKIEQINI